MATSTYQTYLMKSTNGTEWTKLVDIKDAPALGGAPEQLDATTMSDKSTKNINGIQSMDAMEFTANYDPTDYQTLVALADTTTHFAVWLGGTTAGVPDGNLGKFSWDGKLTVYVDALSVNAVKDMKINISKETDIVATFGA